MFAVLGVVFSLLALGRVWLSAEAAEASVESGRLRAEIKAARYAGDMLEIRKSALASPSRIEAVACNTMGMGPATAVEYLKLPAERKQVAHVPTPARKSGFDAALAGAMDLAAGEAQVLLVGDVGLASSE